MPCEVGLYKYLIIFKKGDNQAMESKIIIACDFKDRLDLDVFLSKFRNEQLFLKIGMELYYKEGNALIYDLKLRGYKIFLDLKLHDIPNTVKKAINNLKNLDIDYLTVHSMGGSDMLRAAREAVGDKDIKLLAVTVLTSINETMLKSDLGVKYDMNRAVFKLASMAKNSGASGVICSAKEASEVREYLGEDFIIVTPGIRMQNNTVDDQARVATPKYSVAQVASKLVIGRSITVDNDPYKKYMSIKKEI